MKVIYCANCGKPLQVFRKALPSHSRIIDLVEWHECLEEPLDLDLEPLTSLQPSNIKEEGKDKFVQKLNDLPVPQLLNTDSSLKDRRPHDQVKSTAPPTVFDTLKSMQNSTPAHSIEEDPEQ
jgi:hypothetical protein